MGPEKKIENKSVGYAKKHLGAIARKMNGFGFNHWPDRLFLLTGCPELWVEFKKPGGECTPMQLKIHSDLRAQGREVWVEDNADVFIKKLNAWYVMMRNTLPVGKPMGSKSFGLGKTGDALLAELKHIYRQKAKKKCRHEWTPYSRADRRAQRCMNCGELR